MGSCVRAKRFRNSSSLLASFVSLLIMSAGLAGCRSSNLSDHTVAQTQAAQPAEFSLGRVWKVEEGYYDDPHWVGLWTRRGDTNVFDATWKHRWMNETTRDVVEVQLAKGGQVVVFRRGVNQCYRGTYSPQHPNKVRGKADWFGRDLIWQAEIEY